MRKVKHKMLLCWTSGEGTGSFWCFGELIQKVILFEKWVRFGVQRNFLVFQKRILQERSKVYIKTYFPVFFYWLWISIVQGINGMLNCLIFYIQRIFLYLLFKTFYIDKNSQYINPVNKTNIGLACIASLLDFMREYLT